MSWRKTIDLSSWVQQYARRRYGENAKLALMWQILIDRVYLPVDRWQSLPYPMSHEPSLSNHQREETIDAMALAFRLFADVGLNLYI